MTTPVAKAVIDKAGGSAPSEGELHVGWMRDIARGDPSAYRAMCDRFLVPIHRFAQRMLGSEAEAEDVAQETFLRIWQHASRYTPNAAVSTWIYRIARNLCIDRIRRRKDDSHRISQIDVEERPSLLLARKELSAQVEEALQELPDRQRMALCLVHYEGLSQSEAADVMEVGVLALESLLARGRRTLRKRLAALQHAGADP